MVQGRDRAGALVGRLYDADANDCHDVEEVSEAGEVGRQEHQLHTVQAPLTYQSHNLIIEVINKSKQEVLLRLLKTCAGLAKGGFARIISADALVVLNMADQAVRNVDGYIQSFLGLVVALNLLNALVAVVLLVHFTKVVQSGFDFFIGQRRSRRVIRVQLDVLLFGGHRLFALEVVDSLLDLGELWALLHVLARIGVF